MPRIVFTGAQYNHSHSAAAGAVKSLQDSSFCLLTSQTAAHYLSAIVTSQVFLRHEATAKGFIFRPSSRPLFLAPFRPRRTCDDDLFPSSRCQTFSHPIIITFSVLGHAMKGFWTYFQLKATNVILKFLNYANMY